MKMHKSICYNFYCTHAIKFLQKIYFACGVEQNKNIDVDTFQLIYHSAAPDKMSIEMISSNEKFDFVVSSKDNYTQEISKNEYCWLFDTDWKVQLSISTQ